MHPQRQSDEESLRFMSTCIICNDINTHNIIHWIILCLLPVLWLPTGHLALCLPSPINFTWMKIIFSNKVYSIYILSIHLWFTFAFINTNSYATNIYQLKTVNIKAFHSLLSLVLKESVPVRANIAKPMKKNHPLIDDGIMDSSHQIKVEALWHA